MLNSSKLQTSNWKVRVDGLVENPITLDLNDLTSDPCSTSPASIFSSMK